MVNLMNVMDSEEFCAQIIKDNKTKSNDTEPISDIKVPPALLNTMPYIEFVPLIQL